MTFFPVSFYFYGLHDFTATRSTQTAMPDLAAT